MEDPEPDATEPTDPGHDTSKYKKPLTALNQEMGKADPPQYTRAQMKYACACAERAWDEAHPEVQQHLIRHIAKQGDPVSIALSLVEQMDTDQVRRLMVGVDEYRGQLSRWGVK